MKPPVFSALSSRVLNNGSLYGRFLFGPLPIDISLTIATILRRSLLHTKGSCTITSVEIEGVTHEYALLPGVQESVLEICLNLGEIVLAPKNQNLGSPFKAPNAPFYSFRDGESQASSTTALLQISGPKIVKAKDVRWPKGICCVQPNAHIATLGNNQTLAMRLQISPMSKDPAQNLARLSEKTQSLDTGLKRYPPFTTQTAPLSLQVTQQPIQNFQTSAKNDLWPSRLQQVDSKVPNNPENTQGTRPSPPPIKGRHFLPPKDDIHMEVPVDFEGQKPIGISARQPLPPLNKEGFLWGVTSDENGHSAAPSMGAHVASTDLLPAAPSAHVLPMHNKGQVQLPVLPGAPLAQMQLPVLGKHSTGAQGAGHQSFVPRSFVKASPLPKSYRQQSLERHLLDKSYTHTGRQKSTKNIKLAVSASTYPVEKVNFLIERDDQLAGYRHRIIFEVWTNGSISPRQAIFDSIGWLLKLLYNFRQSGLPRASYEPGALNAP